MKNYILFAAFIFADITLAQSDVFYRSRGLDTDLQLCVNDGGVEVCSIVIDGATGNVAISDPNFSGTVSGLASGDVGLGNVTNESKATMFSSPTFTGTAAFGEMTSSGHLLGNTATAGAPMYSFTSDSNSGIHGDGNGATLISSDSTLKVSIGAETFWKSTDSQNLLRINQAADTSGKITVYANNGSTESLVIDGDGSNNQVLTVTASNTNTTPIAHFNNAETTMSNDEEVIRVTLGDNSLPDTTKFMSFYEAAVFKGSLRRKVGGGFELFNTSDERIKSAISPIDQGLETLMNILAANFKRDDSDIMSSGFIAQQLHKVFPEAVTVGGDDPKTDPWQVSQGSLIPLITASIQDLKKEKDSEIESLRAENGMMKGWICQQDDAPDALCN